MRKFVDFTVMRVICAVVTYGLYLLLLGRLGYDAAYAISYVLGVALAYVTSAAVVFRQPMNRRSALLFPLTYAVQFVLGWLILRACVEWMNVPESLALGISVLLTLPITYLMSRWAVLKR